MSLVLIEDELLAEATPAELAAYREWLEAQALDDAAADVVRFEASWRHWLKGVFPAYVRADFGTHHAEFWEWVWSIEPDDVPVPFVAVWPRGHAKSTSAELACVALAARGKRTYGLYICGTQDQADSHVQSVATMLESKGVERLYPSLAQRRTTKYGAIKGWRRNRLWTGTGFVLDGYGLDTAVRGVKAADEDEMKRPDFMVIDDLDDKLDSLETVERKISALTASVLPTRGQRRPAILAVQNIIHPESIFARLVDGRAEFLARRHVSGPVPSVRDLVTERRASRTVIVDGTPTWAGQDLNACQGDMDDWGESAFRSECQHEITAAPGGMFSHLDFARCRPEEVPALVRVAVWVDPAVTDKKSSDCHGIQADGLGVDGTLYRLFSWEARTSPLDSLCRAIRKAHELGALKVGVETDQGGDTWQSVFREAKAVVEAGLDGLPALGPVAIGFTDAKAGEGHGPKVHRASRMLVDYETGANIVHVIGTHLVLERALHRFPKTKPFDLVDTAYWSWRDLREAVPGRKRLQARRVA